MKIIAVIAIIVLAVSFITPAVAEEAAKKEAAETESAGEKLAEGIEETATGWTEVPKEVAETSEETNPVEGVTVGAVKGAGKAVVKTTEGAVKTATFFVPGNKKSAKQQKK